MPQISVLLGVGTGAHGTGASIIVLVRPLPVAFAAGILPLQQEDDTH
jgi:hypothetical protein